jgi:hypothetical protein
MALMVAGPGVAPAQPLVATAADGVVTFPNGLTDRPFPGWAGPLSLAFSPAGADLYAGAGRGGGPVAVRYTRGGDGRWYKVAGPTQVVSTNGFPGRDFNVGVKLAPGPDALRVTLDGGGPPLLADVDPVTLAFRSQRWVGNPASSQGAAAAVWTPPDCPTPQTRFAWGDRGRRVYLCFEDDSPPEARRRVTEFVGGYWRGYGIDLQLTTWRPVPPPGAKLPPGYYGVVRVVHPEAWFAGAISGGGSRPWTYADDPLAERAWWVKGGDSWQATAHIVCHEMGHAMGLPVCVDLSGPTHRPGNLMNRPLNMGVTPDRMRLDPDQLEAIRLCVTRDWMGGPGIYQGP